MASRMRAKKAEEEYGKILRQVVDLYSKGEHERAVAILEKHPHVYFRPVTHLLVKLYMERGETDKALIALGAHAWIGYSSIEQCATGLLKAGNADIVEQILKLYIKNVIPAHEGDWGHPVVMRAYAIACKYLGIVYLERGQPEKAVPFLKRAQELDPMMSGLKIRLEKAQQESGGKEIPDDILGLIPGYKCEISDLLNSFTAQSKYYVEHYMRSPADFKKYHQDYYSPEPPCYKGRINSILERITGEYWKDECTKALKQVHKKYRWFYREYLYHEIEEILGREKMEELGKHLDEALPKKLEEGNESFFRVYEKPTDIHLAEFAIQIFAKKKIKELQLPIEVPRFRKCKHCQEKFFEGNIGGPLAECLFMFSDEIDYCPKCLAAAFVGGFKKPKDREIMKEHLHKLVYLLGFVPSKGDFLCGSIIRPFLKRLPKDKAGEIIPILIEMLPPPIYEKEFGSWSNALAEAGVASGVRQRGI